MRFRMLRNMEGTGFRFYREDEKLSQSVGIEIDEQIPTLLPLFSEFAGQYFCVIAYEKERPMWRMVCHEFSPAPQPRDVWQKILWGRLASRWEQLPIIDRSLHTEQDRAPWPGCKGDLLTVLRQEFSWYFSQPPIICFGDDECWKLMRESSRQMSIKSSTWADILFCFEEPLPAEKVPEFVRKALSDRKRLLMEEQESLKQKSEALKAESDRITNKLIDVGTKLYQYNRLKV